MLSNKFIELIKLRLESLGYHSTKDDDLFFEFDSTKIFNSILIETNLDEVPQKLYHVTADLVSAEFLNMRRLKGKLEGFDLEPALKSLSEGGRSMSFNVGASIDEKFEYLIQRKRDHLYDLLGAFRRMDW